MLQNKINPSNTKVKITKNMLVTRVLDRLNSKEKKKAFAKNQVETFMEALLKEISLSLAKKIEKIQLLGFASFETIKTKERPAVNPQTKEKIIIPSKFVPKVSFSDVLRGKVDTGEDLLDNDNSDEESDSGYDSDEESDEDQEW